MKSYKAYLIIVLLLINSCKKYDPGTDLCPVCPIVTSVAPSNGRGGILVTITGKNFNSDYSKNIVKFNGIKVDPDSIVEGDANFIKVFVPTRCGTGNVTVDLDDELTNSGAAVVFNYDYVFETTTLLGIIRPDDSLIVDGIFPLVKCYKPTGMCIDNQDYIYFIDSMQYCVRRIDLNSGVVKTIYTSVHTGSKINSIFCNSTNLYFWEGFKIREITLSAARSNNPNNFSLYTIPSLPSTFNVVSESWSLQSVADAQHIYVVDTLNTVGRIKISSHSYDSTYAFTFGFPRGICKDNAGSFYVSETGLNTIRKFTWSTQSNIFAGGGSGAAGVIDGQGPNAKFKNIVVMTTDSYGNIYVSESDPTSNRVRKITPEGNVKTILGDNNAITQNGIGSDAKINGPGGICVDSKGFIYVVDCGSSVIRKLYPL